MQRKHLLYAVFLVGLVCMALTLRGARWAPQRFAPPEEDERKAAVGSMARLSSTLQSAFDPQSDSFAPIPKPGPSDWLANISEAGQTYAQYLRSDPNRPNNRRTTIYLQPLGDFPPEKAPDLDRLAEFARAYFDMPISVLPVQPVQGLPVRSRPRETGRQILSGDVLEWLKPRIPSDAYCLLAVTMTDLYPDPKWNFVFGQGSLKDRVGVYSFARYQPQQRKNGEDEAAASLLLIRSCKILAHETGHMYGIKHCVHFHCLMNGSNGLAETDAAPIHLCPVCLRKLHSAKPFDIDQRYLKLKTLSDQFGWKMEADWLRARLKSLAR